MSHCSPFSPPTRRLALQWQQTVSQNSRFLCLLFHLCEAVGHGALWLAGCCYVLWKSKSNTPVYEVTFNLIYALLLDIIIVGLLKNAFKRPRPSGGESRGDIGPDAYSFPSGHASRAVLISLFIQHVFRLSPLARGLIAINLLWFVLTRVWLGRHYLGDVIVGSLNGYCAFKLKVAIECGNHRARHHIARTVLNVGRNGGR
jgi:membrane-associated phospholipid phosphatase